MEPTNFAESNSVLGPPKGMTEDEVRSLSCFRDGKATISCWKPTEKDLQRLKETGQLWLIHMSPSMPPVEVTTEYPFVVNEKT